MNAIIRRRVIEPLYCWAVHSPKLRYWHKLERTQYLPETQLQQIQWLKLKKLLRFIYENNTFYKLRFQNAGVTPDDIVTPKDMLLLPLLSKAEVRTNTKKMISKNYDLKALNMAKTGGSTGKALELFFTEECSEIRNACARRHDCWTGWKPGEPIAACWGNPHKQKTLKYKCKQSLLQPIIYLDTMHIDEQSVRSFVRECERKRTTLLYGHAHSIFMLAKYLQDLGIGFPQPKGIITTSMLLFAFERAVIEKVFETKVNNRYGCEEVGLIGCECEEHDGMHLNIEHLFIEFINDDGKWTAAGEAGKIVVTDLVNWAMPLLRYQVEDVGIPTKRKCGCSRGLPIMELVAGRVADFLIKRDGSRVAGISLIENTLTRFSGLDQMQIIQKNYDDFEIKIVEGQKFSCMTINALSSYIRSIFGDNSKVKYTFVDRIAPERSGKYRFSICRVIER